MDPITVAVGVVTIGILGAKKLNDLRKERAEERAKRQEQQQKQETNKDSPIDK